MPAKWQVAKFPKVGFIIKKMDVITANNNFKSCIEYTLTDSNLVLKYNSINTMVIEGQIT